MKVTKNPYGANYGVKVPPETIQKENAQASGKAKARYPHTPLGPDQDNSDSGKKQTPAYTPGLSGIPDGA
jgi:hypothetical protein